MAFSPKLATVNIIVYCVQFYKACFHRCKSLIYSVVPPLNFFSNTNCAVQGMVLTVESGLNPYVRPFK